MFPQKFISDHKHECTSHHAIQFRPAKSKEEILSLLRELEVKKFMNPDRGDIANGNVAFDHKAIFGCPSYQVRAGCCAFTRAGGFWCLYPIHKTELANVGLVEEDLIEWLKFLNDMKAGFEYYYLGEQECPEYISLKGRTPLYNSSSAFGWRCNTNDYYWVAVPSFDSSVSAQVPYLHWVALRYLINTFTSPNLVNQLGSRLPYYNIPRITLYFHKNFGLTRLRAFLYAHIMSPFYSGYGLCYSDFMGYVDKSRDIDYTAYQPPCVSLRATQFKELWYTSRNSEGMLNLMLCQSNYEKSDTVKKIPGLLHLQAPYNYKEAHKLFREGKYEEAVEHVRKSYQELNRKLKADLNVKKAE
jgi:hypothetical protein